MAKAKKRARHKMPAAIRAALSKRGVLAAYNARPAYQRNDYLGWIDAAHRDATKAKRTEQMLRELERGGVYMGMKHKPSAKKAKAKKARQS
jgi:uncharacterized protein YdeI (YjbR/CyaY-like superfamily)